MMILINVSIIRGRKQDKIVSSYGRISQSDSHDERTYLSYGKENKTVSSNGMVS